MRQLLIIEAGIEANKLIATLNYDGTPMTAEFVRGKVLDRLRPKQAQAAE